MITYNKYVSKAKNSENKRSVPLLIINKKGSPVKHNNLTNIEVLFISLLCVCL